MLTPQEVSERSFRKSSFGGYFMPQVDEFLDVLTADYTSLYNENAVLKSKLKTMVDKVDEYRSTEDAMRKALMAAQRMADDMVQKAEKRRDEILKQAEAEARGRIDALHREYDAERFRLASAKKATADYVEQVREIHTRQLEYLDGLGDLLPQPQAPDHSAEAPQGAVEDKAEEIDSNVQRILANAMAAAKADAQKDLSDTAEYAIGSGARSAAEQEEGTPARSGAGKFDNLQFGKDYKIQ